MIMMLDFSIEFDFQPFHCHAVTLGKFFTPTSRPRYNL